MPATQSVSRNEYTGPDQHEQHWPPDSSTLRMPEGRGKRDCDGNPESHRVDAFRKRKPQTNGGEERRPKGDASRTESAHEQGHQSPNKEASPGAGRQLKQDRSVRRTIAVRMCRF